MLLYALKLHGLDNVQSTQIQDSDNVPMFEPNSENVFKDEKETRDSFAALLLSGVIILGLLAAYVLRMLRCKYIHETGAFILIGAAVGALVRFCGTLEQLQSAIRFDVEFFFVVLLPPIIFESGYNMNNRAFFRNISSIVTFAFIGTLISAATFSALMYGASSLLGITRTRMSLIECAVFGSFISATDPVTVLAIFKQLSVDEDLYNNVFGESVLNDAVAIVLYKTLISHAAGLGDSAGGYMVLETVGQFMLVLSASVISGCFIGALGALLFKYTRLEDYPTLESSIFVIYSYISYTSVNSIGLSGIVNIMFCAIVMSYYASDNLSEKSRHLISGSTKMFAYIAESFVFCYLGLAIFSFNEEYDAVMVIITFLACLLSRAVNIFPLSWIMAKCNIANIPAEHQTVMWFSGLRGAMAFALSLDAVNARLGKPVVPSAKYMMSTTLLISLFMVLFFGGATPALVQKLKVVNVSTTPSRHSDEEMVDLDEGAPSTSSAARPSSNQSFFTKVDRNWLRPFFTRRNSTTASFDA